MARVLRATGRVIVIGMPPWTVGGLLNGGSGICMLEQGGGWNGEVRMDVVTGAKQELELGGEMWADVM